jgi:hypothetical protein
MRNAYRILIGNLKGIDSSGKLCVEWMTTLKWTLKERDAWLHIMFCSRQVAACFEHGHELFVSIHLPFAQVKTSNLI